MFTPRLPTNLMNIGGGYSYSRVFPKYIIRGFRHKNSDLLNLKNTFGLVYFSSKCLGAPGLVQGGAISTVVDTLGGDLAISSNNASHLYFTRKITVKFQKFIRLETVVKFDCKFINPPPKSRENDVFVHNNALLVDCICNMALAGPNDITFLNALDDIEINGWRATWAKQPRVVKIPSNYNGFWTKDAKQNCEKLLLNSPIELKLVDINRDFPAMNISSQIETIYNNPPNQIFWNFSPSTTPYIDLEDPDILPELIKHPPKIRRKIFWRGINRDKNTKILAGIYVFSNLTQGPPGRPHGGSIASTFDDAQGALVVRERGFMPAHNTTKLVIEYKGATPLHENYHEWLILTTVNVLQKQYSC